MSSALNFSLPGGGRFNRHRSKGFIDEILFEESRKVGPADYTPSHPAIGEPEGGRFGISNAKSEIDWIVHYAKQRPGPSDYDPIPLPSDGGIISRAKPKTSIEWIIYNAEQLPGPGAYEVGTEADPRGRYGLQLPEGGRFNISKAKSELDTTIHQGKSAPGPATYEMPRWPCPTHGRFTSAATSGTVDHLATDGAGRSFSSPDMYRNNSFRMPPSERSQSVPAHNEAPSVTRQSVVEIQGAEAFKQKRADAAKSGSAEDAIDLIFEFLERTRSKVMDVFQRIDTDGSGELDVDEFRHAFQLMGLDLPRSQVIKVIDKLDDDGNGNIDLEEFITKMKELARTRRTQAKADAAIPQWIKDAEAMKPSGCQDLGWRSLPPSKIDKAPPVVYKVPPAPRPRSGGGMPFGPNGGRWRAPDGWEGTHAGWQVKENSAFGVAERWPVHGDGAREPPTRLAQASATKTQQTLDNSITKGETSVQERGRSPRRDPSSNPEDWVGNSRHILSQGYTKDVSLYGADQIDEPRLKRGPGYYTVSRDRTSLDRVAHLTHANWAQSKPQYLEKLQSLKPPVDLVAGMERSPSRRQSGLVGDDGNGPAKHAGLRVASRHPLLARAGSRSDSMRPGWNSGIRDRRGDVKNSSPSRAPHWKRHMAAGTEPLPGFPNRSALLPDLSMIETSVSMSS